MKTTIDLTKTCMRCGGEPDVLMHTDTRVEPITAAGRKALSEIAPIFDAASGVAGMCATCVRGLQAFSTNQAVEPTMDEGAKPPTILQ